MKFAYHGRQAARQHTMVAAVVVMVCALAANADYMIGSFGYSLGTATHVVEAKVTEITKAQHARLEITQYLKGTNAPRVIVGTALSPGHFGMRAGKRYIIMLSGNRLFEETTFYEISKGDDGTMGCQISEFTKKWMGVSNTWVNLEEMRRLMTPPKPK
jgi:hypothetical protein